MDYFWIARTARANSSNVPESMGEKRDFQVSNYIKFDSFNIRANDQQLSKLLGEGWNSGHPKPDC